VIRRLAEQLGVHPEALRNWIRQDEARRGEREVMCPAFSGP
jgi:transposase